MTKFAILIFLFAAGVISASAQERYLKPVDEGPDDASFVAFRARALRAVEQKDAAFIKSIVDKDIRVDFGGGFGIKDFLKHWSGLSPKSEFWPQFEFTLKNGGEYAKMKNRGPKQFWAPYIYASFPEDLDGTVYSAVTGENVRLRAKPNASSAVIGQLSYNIVKTFFDESNPDPQWIEIETLAGKRGWVSAQYVRSPIGYRACFEKIGGKWTLTIFVAGD
ncbi:MAG: SH3 domain-containing protein [Pyrinomonadaceae bacterium]|nr:SH3 domain-containing protein [Pyrinomonadaceae bacterium]